MSGFFIFLAVVTVIGYAMQEEKKNNASSKTLPDEFLKRQSQDKKDITIVRSSKSTDSYETKQTINNYYTQNNIYVQTTTPTSKAKGTDHTAKVWRELGYQVKRGESYSYKHYGQEIYTPNQVERIGTLSYREPLQIGYGLSQNQEKVRDRSEFCVNRVK
ncbi:MAG: hypothetical protein EOL93_06795 [Epsilonproteobacteria bacterium]|nr:hypothetical protein [Campylobacterota bacterium]